jgi:peptidoglycan hydrolase CwlO-like protein
MESEVLVMLSMESRKKSRQLVKWVKEKMARVSQSDRLDRIEEKIDKLSEVLIAMARAEEKIQGLTEDHDKMYSRINNLSQKIDKLDEQVVKNTQTVTTIHKLFWVVIAAATAAFASQVFNWF